ncbi:alpha-2,8-polysialyltransferase family protein [Otariodibacter oris]|uniref:Alpha-2,8-polysialyltransferase (POLYST) n=1 Tax=Otariodibacter oris TaxID=1032623 RepID=A0A420XGN6_9PAST|nr:alpha-2,8-polysialyltransferase family protein [Otariodibacter oris]QGM80109.1 hypothetical protein A6A10_01120 [Otariodibacter oris]RKR71936.1 alpha-2,8-polysialyltransferase (POLYST) [Otariodibacter oris]
MKKKGLFNKIKSYWVNPVNSIQNSPFFTVQYLEDFKKTKNLFVISHLGQLAQVEALIKEENFLNCVLVILYTVRNRSMPELIAKKVNKALFNRITFLQLPSFPNKIHIKSLFRIMNSYRSMLSSIRPHRLFVLSFEKHYCLLIKKAREMKIEVNLIEEGTATYKYSSREEANLMIKDSLTKLDRRSAFFIRHLPMLSCLRPVLRVNYIFDKVYSSFPDMLENTFKFKESKEFFIYKDISGDKFTRSIQSHYNMTNEDILFLNQRYPFPQDSYANILIFILMNYINKYGGKVFIKLHPKDPESLKIALVSEVEKAGLSNNIIIIDEYGFLVERLIFVSKPKKIVSLTSTTLIYGKKILPDTESITIYPLVRDMLFNDKKETLAQYFLEADEHFSILRKFKNISAIGSIVDI